MRAFEEARKRLLGDPALAQQYLGQARVLLGALLEQMRLGGLQQLKRHITLPDGAVITVRSFSGLCEIAVDVRRAITQQLKQWLGGIKCLPRTDSCDIGWGKPYTDENGNPINPPLGTCGGTDPYALLSWRETRWGITRSVDALAAALDWKGAGRVLTYAGPPGRYPVDPNNPLYTFTWGFREYVYYQGVQYRVAASSTPRVVGAALTQVDKQWYFVVATYLNDSMATLYLYTKQFSQTEQDAAGAGGAVDAGVYNAQTNPLGWRLIGSIADADGASHRLSSLAPATGWFFDSTGRNAVAVRERWNGAGWVRFVRQLTLDAALSTVSVQEVAGETANQGTSSASWDVTPHDYTYSPTLPATEHSSSAPCSEWATGWADQTYGRRRFVNEDNQATGEQLLFADYRGTRLCLAKLQWSYTYRVRVEEVYNARRTGTYTKNDDPHNLGFYWFPDFHSETTVAHNHGYDMAWSASLVVDGDVLLTANAGFEHLVSELDTTTADGDVNICGVAPPPVITSTYSVSGGMNEQGEYFYIDQLDLRHPFVLASRYRYDVPSGDIVNGQHKPYETNQILGMYVHANPVSVEDHKILAIGTNIIEVEKMPLFTYATNNSDTWGWGSETQVRDTSGNDRINQYYYDTYTSGRPFVGGWTGGPIGITLAAPVGVALRFGLHYYPFDKTRWIPTGLYEGYYDSQEPDWDGNVVADPYGHVAMSGAYEWRANPLGFPGGSNAATIRYFNHLDEGDFVTVTEVVGTNPRFYPLRLI